jgi:hypothetical protein
MKRQLMFGTMLSAALAVGVAAQQPPAGGSPAGSPQPPSDRPAAQSMTVTGCLQAASDAAGGAPAAAAEPAAAGAKAGGFVLTNVTPAGSAASGAKTPGAATGTTGAGATGTSGSSAASRYRLTGGENLQQYVGQKVEVTGSVAGGSGASSTAPGAAGSPAGASASGRSQDQSFRVASVRPTGDKCN